MKFYLLLFLSVILSVSCQDSGKYKSAMNMPVPQKTMDSISYMIGYNMGKSMRTDSIAVNIDYLFQGILKGFKGDSSCLTEKDVQKLQSTFQASMMKKQDAKMKQQNEAMIAEGKRNKIGRAHV